MIAIFATQESRYKFVKKDLLTRICISKFLAHAQRTKCYITLNQQKISYERVKGDDFGYPPTKNSYNIIPWLAQKHYSTFDPLKNWVFCMPPTLNMDSKGRIFTSFIIVLHKSNNKTFPWGRGRMLEGLDYTGGVNFTHTPKKLISS